MNQQENIVPVSFCDECNKREGEYRRVLKWNYENNIFVCPHGHKETIKQALRTYTKKDLFELVVSFLNSLPNPNT